MPELSSASPFAGRRVLVVEDDYMMAQDLRRDLQKLGATVVGPVPRVPEALRLIATQGALDGAILDVNLSGEMVYPVADVLRARGIPFVFSTGYGEWALPEAYKQVPRCEKPIDMLRAAIGLFG